MKCHNDTCKNTSAQKCIEYKCGRCCTDIYCETHLLSKNIVKYPEFVDPSLLCKCTNYKTKVCDYDECDDCCNYDDCLQHQLYKKMYNTKPDEIDDMVLGEDYVFCSICTDLKFLADDSYICTSCNKSFCDDCKLNERKEIRCGAKGCYYCRRGICNNNILGDYYCPDCFVSDDPICEICGHQDNFTCWTCDNCDKTFCQNCKPSNDIIRCSVLGCFYCAEGHCWNSYVDKSYCDDCYDNLSDENDDMPDELDDSDNVSNDSIKESVNHLLENKNYDDIFDMFGYKTKKLKTKQSGKCAICMENKINCRPSCKHGYCVECFIKNTIIYEKNSCAFCREQIDKNVKLYDMV